jgi:hypothetical protein
MLIYKHLTFASLAVLGTLADPARRSILRLLNTSTRVLRGGVRKARWTAAGDRDSAIEEQESSRFIRV